METARPMTQDPAPTPDEASFAAHATEPGGGGLLGDLPALRRDLIGTFVRAAEGRDVGLLRVAHKRLHVVSHPDAVKRVLVDNARAYGKDTVGFRRIRPVVGRGLLTSEGEFWKRQRRIANPAFQRQRIAAFADTMARVSEETAATWAERSRRGEAIHVEHEMMRTTLRIVGLTLLTRDVGDDAEGVGEALTTCLEHAVTRVRTPWSLPEWVPTPKNRRFARALAVLDGVVNGIIAERRAAKGAGGPPQDGADLLDLLLAARDEETGEGMDDLQLRDEVMTIFLAGHETTAMALTWTLWLLGEHPLELRRLQDEVRAVIDDRPLTLADLAKMPRTEHVVQEAMRLYPPAWNVGRSVEADDALMGHPVRRGEFVYVCPYITQRRPDLFPAPDSFRPDRFAEGALEGLPRFAYFPFGGGTRKCIGDHFAMMEARILLATLVGRLDLEHLPGPPPRPLPLITLRPSAPVRMRALVPTG